MILQNPSEWLKKQLEIVDVAMSVQAANSVIVGEPLVRSPGLQIAVLAPVFAVIGNKGATGETTATIHVGLEPVKAVISCQQLQWLRTFYQTVSTVLAARGELTRLQRHSQHHSMLSVHTDHRTFTSSQPRSRDSRVCSRQTTQVKRYVTCRRPTEAG